MQCHSKASGHTLSHITRAICTTR